MAETKNNVSTLVKSLMDNAEGVLTSKTVVGEPIRIDDTIIIPLSDVTIGCGAGANNSLNGTKKDSGMGGFSAKMSPTAVLIIRDGYTKVVNVKTQDTLGKLVDSLPELIDKIRNKNTRVTDDQAVDAAFPEGAGAAEEPIDAE